MTLKEREYWKLAKQLNENKITSFEFEYMLSARNISYEDAKRYERYKTINWAFGLIFACATFYYFLISDYGVIHGKYRQETGISSARK